MNEKSTNKLEILEPFKHFLENRGGPRKLTPKCSVTGMLGPMLSSNNKSRKSGKIEAA
jgi:hypothetical protein